MRTIAIEQRALLEDAFRDGCSRQAAAELAGVSLPTVTNYFAAFRSEGIPAGRRPPRPRRFRWGRYTGPDWIGKAASVR